MLIIRDNIFFLLKSYFWRWVFWIKYRNYYLLKILNWLSNLYFHYDIIKTDYYLCFKCFIVVKIKLFLGGINNKLLKLKFIFIFTFEIKYFKNENYGSPILRTHFNTLLYNLNIYYLK